MNVRSIKQLETGGDYAAVPMHDWLDSLSDFDYQVGRVHRTSPPPAWES